VRPFIILAILLLGAAAIAAAGRYLGRDMDDGGRTALALFFTPLPLFIFSLFAFARSKFGWNDQVIGVLLSFGLSYGVMFLVGWPLHALLRRSGCRRLWQYIAVSITASLATLFAFSQLGSSATDYKADLAAASTLAPGAIPAAALTASIFWVIAIRRDDEFYDSDLVHMPSQMSHSLHWFAIVPAVITFFVAGAWSFNLALKGAWQAQLVCARENYAQHPDGYVPWLEYGRSGPLIDLKTLGCSAEKALSHSRGSRTLSRQYPLRRTSCLSLAFFS